MFPGANCAAETEATRTDPRRPEAREHHVGRPGPAAVQGQGHRLRFGQSRV